MTGKPDAFARDLVLIVITGLFALAAAHIGAQAGVRGQMEIERERQKADQTRLSISKQLDISQIGNNPMSLQWAQISVRNEGDVPARKVRVGVSSPPEINWIVTSGHAVQTTSVVSDTHHFEMEGLARGEHLDLEYVMDGLASWPGKMPPLSSLLRYSTVYTSELVPDGQIGVFLIDTENSPVWKAVIVEAHCDNCPPARSD